MEKIIPALGHRNPEHGKTLRDEFAMASLTGILASYEAGEGHYDNSDVAAGAYRLADAMLEARTR